MQERVLGGFDGCTEHMRLRDEYGRPIMKASEVRKASDMLVKRGIGLPSGIIDQVSNHLDSQVFHSLRRHQVDISYVILVPGI